MVFILDEVAVSKETSLPFMKFSAFGSKTIKFILSAFIIRASKISYTMVVFALTPVDGLHP